MKPRSIPVPTPTKTPREARDVVGVAPTLVLPPLPSATPALSPEPPPIATTAPLAPTSLLRTQPLPTASATGLAPTNNVTVAPAATQPSELPAPALAATRTPQPKAAVPAPATEALPPRRGGSWDLEDGFYTWQSPHEGFTAFVANGWLPLSKVYDPAAPPRLNENKFLPNIHSGERSQEISFDWRSGEAGIFRTAEVVPGHRYVVEAWAKYVPSESGLGLYLGIDLRGGDNSGAGSVTWYPWRDMTPDRWVVTQEKVRAKGGRVTLFLRAVHPLAADGGNKPGGNTMFDDISVVDAGL